MTIKSLLTHVLLFTAAVLAAGCATPPVMAPRTAAELAGSLSGGTPPKARGEQLATMETYQYLRIDPEKMGILNAADDGRFTYIAFASRSDRAIEFFDSDGKPLTAARAGAVVAIAGIHKGVLVRLGRSSSYVVPNPRAAPDDRPNLELDPDVIEARTRVELALTQLPAFRRALERADAAKATPAATEAATHGSASMPPSAMKPGTVVGRADDLSYVKTPEGSLVRVFFASGGLTIVRPYDGVQRLYTEAAGAQEIRIAGYTDSIGSEASKPWLAQARAEAIRMQMIQRGVAPERIVISRPSTGQDLAEKSTVAGRAMNRRVEVLFVKTAKPTASTQ
jgi:flagellar motor protein MotB